MDTLYEEITKDEDAARMLNKLHSCSLASSLNVLSWDA